MHASCLWVLVWRGLSLLGGNALQHFGESRDVLSLVIPIALRPGCEQ